MWRVLRKSLLLLLTAVLGLLAGVLIRFAFGRGLQWQAPAAAGVEASRSQKTENAKAAPAPVLLPQNPESSPVLERLKAIAARDSDALERMLQEVYDAVLDPTQQGQEMMDLLYALTEADPLRALAWARKNILGNLGVRAVFDRWREKDRAAAETWAAANAPDILKQAQQSPKFSDEELAQKLKDDPAGLEALFSRDPGLVTRTAKLRAQQDPAAAFTWAQSLKTPAQRQSALGLTFEAWAQRDPAAAAEAWKSLPKGKAARDAFGKIVSEMPGEQALTWLRTLEPTQMVRAAMAQRLPDGAEREALLAALLPGSWESFALGERLAQAIKSGPSPQAFAALAAAGQAGAKVDEGVSKTLYKNDPAGTLAALSALPDGTFKIFAAAQIGDWLAEQPKSEAMERFAQMPPGPFRDAAAEKLAAGLAKENPQSALEFLRQQSPEARGSALPEVMAAWFSHDPAAARAQWDALPPEDQRTASTELADMLTWKPTAEKMALLTTLPDVPPETYKEAAKEWVIRAPEQASAWVDSLPAGTQRDAAVGSMVTALTQHDWDPERAVVWAGTIEDADERLGALRTTLELWSLRDAAAAQAARQLLSPEDQQALTTP